MEAPPPPQGAAQEAAQDRCRCPHNHHYPSPQFSAHMGLARICEISILQPKRSRMLSMPYTIIVGRSRESPHAMTLTSAGRPMGRNISGRNTPLFPISIHRPDPPEPRESDQANTSILGSVYGLYAGLKRNRSPRPSFLKNWCKRPPM